MKTTRHPFRSIRSTAEMIDRLAREFYSDMDYLDNHFFTRRRAGETEYRRQWKNYHGYVKYLSYIEDPPTGDEYLSRPGLIMHEWVPGDGVYRDCDDKDELIVVMAYRHRLPYESAFVGIYESVHHIYPEIIFPWGREILDATFPERGEWGKKLYSEKTRKVWNPNEKKFRDESHKEAIVIK